MSDQHIHEQALAVALKRYQEHNPSAAVSVFSAPSSTEKHSWFHAGITSDGRFRLIGQGQTPDDAVGHAITCQQHEDRLGVGSTLCRQPVRSRNIRHDRGGFR